MAVAACLEFVAVAAVQAAVWCVFYGGAISGTPNMNVSGGLGGDITSQDGGDGGDGATIGPINVDPE